MNSIKRIKQYNSYFSIMKYINSKIKYSNQIVLSTAMIYFHKYFLSNESLINELNIEDKLLLCSSLIFLSCKAINRLISINSILAIVNEILINKNKNKKNYADLEFLKEKIFTYEQDILCSLDFDLNVDLPYKMLPKLKQFFEGEKIQLNTKKLVELCCYYMNDTFILPLSLYYLPDAIAISCVSLLSHKFKFNIDIDKLIELSSYPIHKEDIIHIEQLISKIYDKSTNEKEEDNSSTKDESSVKKGI